MSIKTVYYKDIICLATKRIDDDLPTNVQHLMLRLAEKHRILYIEPPVDNIFLLRNPDFLLRERNLKSLCPNSLKPFYPIIFSREKLIPFLLPFFNRKKIIASIRQAIKTFQIKPEILWLFRPQDYWIVKHLNPTYLFYHITDKYNTMPVNAKNKRNAIRLNKLEIKVLKNADIVFCTARSLWQDISSKHKKAYYAGNVADFEHFSKANDSETEIPQDIASLPHPIVGFFGAINDFKLDYNLVQITAETFPNGSVVLIGPMRNSIEHKKEKIPQNANIHYLGLKDYSSLPNYLKGFDICTIPYKDSEYTQHVFPLKFFEYLSAGKPVVSTPLPSLENFNNLFYKARNERQWIAALKMAVSENSKKKICDRKKSAFENSWTARVSEIEKILCTL